MPEVNYKVGLIGKLDMLKFKNMPKVRNAAIDASPSTPLKGIEPTNEKAKAHHPKQIEFVIDDILQNGPDAKTVILKKKDGERLPLFRAEASPRPRTRRISSYA